MLRRIFYSFCVIILSFYHKSSEAQEIPIDPVSNQTSHEAYNLVKDTRGYLWVAHDFGISRFDGSNFINIDNPYPNSPSVTDLMEDSRGRIWCHNFSGQIFYVENLQLRLLKEYEHEEKHNYPRFTICGDELIATSIKGLFIYNLLTTKAKYLTIPEGVTSLTRVGNKVVCYGNTGFYCYEADKPIVKLVTNFQLPEKHNFKLQSGCRRDTFYSITNPSALYYTMTLEKNVVKAHSINKERSFINTINVDSGRTWVHTKEYSFTTDRRERVDGMNLSHVITDGSGHKWMTSLKKGLCVQYNTQQLRKLDFSAFDKQDDVRRIYGVNKEILLGTTNGKLYKLTNSSSLQYLVSTPQNSGAVEQLTFIGEDQYLIATSAELFLFDSRTQALKKLPVKVTVKDMVVNQGTIYLATIDGVQSFPLKEVNNIHSPFLSDVLFNKKTRCRSIAFLNNTLFAAYNNGLYSIDRNNLQQLFYKNQPIYASSVRAIEGKIVVGTFNQGLLILEKGEWRKLTEKDGLMSNFVRSINTTVNSNWVLYTNGVQELNARLTGVENVLFPFSKVSSINDFFIFNEQLFIATVGGVYTIEKAKPALGTNSTTYIDKIIANGTGTISNNKLKHNENHLQFHVSTPFFSPYSKIIYQYRIRNSHNSAWQYGAPGQTAFNVVALEPGVYSFEIVATNESKKIISQPATYQFEILPPWYLQWYIKVLVVVMAAGLGFSIVWSYYRRRLRKQQLVYEQQLAIQAERQRISAEIHDDVGAGLSAIRLLTEITRNNLPDNKARQEVGKIHASISELSHKMREVIWSLNTDNDHLENLLHYIRRQALLLFENSPIRLKVVFPTEEIPGIVIKGEKRRHIYLSVKEALHNCLKHSRAENCTLTMHIKSNQLCITVADDGKGFVPLQKEYAGNGLPGMRRRMQQVNGLFTVELQEKTKVQFMIPLNEKA